MTGAAHVLDTRRQVLRWLEPAGAGFIFELTNDPDGLQHIGDRGGDAGVRPCCLRPAADHCNRAAPWDK